MDFEFSADQELLRETIKRFLQEQAPLTYVRAQLDDERGTSDAVWAGLADLGVVGLSAPEAHGGAGMGMVDQAVVLEELGRMVHPGPFTSSAIGAISAVSIAGSDDDQARLLPGLAAGTTTGTVAWTEPNRRSMWHDPQTTAQLDGTQWTLTGTKTHVYDAVAADVIFVTAATDEGLGLFAVEAGAPGLDVSALDSVDGTRKVASVTLTGTPATRLGTTGADATEAVAEIIDRITVAWTLDGVGAAARSLEMAVEYAKERHQFGKPIGSFQAVQLLCADMLVWIELGRAAAYYAAWACDDADAAERHRATTMAKAYASDAFYKVGANAVQVFAGIGFTWEHDVHLYYKRLLTLQHAFGGSAEHLAELANIALDSADRASSV